MPRGSVSHNQAEIDRDLESRSSSSSGLSHSTIPLLSPGETCVQATPHWFLTRDGDRQALALYRRHYSAHQYRDGRRDRGGYGNRWLFVGPGEKCVLISADADALFVWRKFLDDSGQQGVNCAVFRNEGTVRSSALICEAVAVAQARWPGERLYTYVDAAKVRSAQRKRRGVPDPRPGHCFLMAGWAHVLDADGEPLRTSSGKLMLAHLAGGDA